MSRQTRLGLLAALQGLTLTLGVGLAMAQERPIRTVEAQIPPRPALAPTTIAPRPATSPAKRSVTAAPAVRRTATPKATKARRVVRPRARATVHTAVKPTHKVTLRRTAAPAASAQAHLMQVVGRIPGYRSGDALWSYKSGLGSWGMAVMGAATVYISPDVPADKLYDVVVHEWSHLLTVRVYGGDVPLTMASVNRYFGGTGLVGSERAADCMALLLGAKWTHYTPCTNPTWKAGARKLVNLQRL